MDGMHAGSGRIGAARYRPESVLRGRFELVREIGRGGSSRVFEARDLAALHLGLAEPAVAIKILRADHADAGAIALMHRHARRLRDLVHPNIVRVYDSDMDGDTHFMVMELLAGRPLAQVLRASKGNRLSSAGAERLVADVCAGLDFAHARGIVHGDIKLGNVFIERSGRARLIDFNPASQRCGNGRLDAITPLYASPQRLAGAEPSPGDDLFSLAVLTYVALTGKRPFGDLNARDAGAAGLVPERPAHIDRARWRALSAAMAFDDERRTPSAARFARQFLRKSPLTAIRHAMLAW